VGGGGCIYKGKPGWGGRGGGLEEEDEQEGESSRGTVGAWDATARRWRVGSTFLPGPTCQLSSRGARLRVLHAPDWSAAGLPGSTPVWVGYAHPGDWMTCGTGANLGPRGVGRFHVRKVHRYVVATFNGPTKAHTDEGRRVCGWAHVHHH
jgi:hypothetical protein